jgi:hypothetical protein
VPNAEHRATPPGLRGYPNLGKDRRCDPDARYVTA